MKKNLFPVIALLLACLLALGGCGCKHEWQAATCRTPQICSLCQATQGELTGHDWQAATCEAGKTCAVCGLTEGEAPGHSWQEASCEVPETCAVCGLTRGEKPEHSYGQWAFTQTDMVRVCTVCGNAESTAIDRELYLKQKLQGHWDFYSMEYNGIIIYDHTIGADSLLNNLHVDFEKGSWWHNGWVIFEVAPRFVEYQNVDGAGYYYFTITFAEDGSSQTMVYVDTLDQIMMDLQGSTYILGKNQELATALTGAWAQAGANGITILELKDDRTFVAEGEGSTFTGTWHLRSICTYKQENSDVQLQKAGLDLFYEKDGTMAVKSQTIALGAAGTSVEAALQESGLTLKLEKINARLGRTTAEIVDELRHVDTLSREKMLGQWVSTKRYAGEGAEFQVVPAAGEYAITILEDGTFTSQFDKEYTGTWAFKYVTLVGDKINYQYDVQFRGVQSSTYAYVGDTLTTELHIVGSGATCDDIVVMEKMTQEQREQLKIEKEKAQTAIVGQWNSYKVLYGMAEIPNTDYVITFHEDGTFTTNLEEGSCGTWALEQVELLGSVNAAYHYRIIMEGSEIYFSASCNTVQNEIDVYLYTDGDGRTVTFARIDEKDLERVAQAPVLICGTWSGSELTRYDKQSQKSVPAGQENHSITVKEDGTYTSTMPQLAGGKWSYKDVTEEGLRYLFFLEDGNAYVFCLNDQNVLEAWFKKDDQTFSIDMTK